MLLGAGTLRFKPALNLCVITFFFFFFIKRALFVKCLFSQQFQKLLCFHMDKLRLNEIFYIS